MALEEIRNERIKKLHALRESGKDPYPADTPRTHTIAETHKKFTALAKAKKEIAIAGRVRARREHGGSTFFDLHDGSGALQAYIKRDDGADAYDEFLARVDIGDIIAIRGTLFKTKKQEETLGVQSWTMLVKTLRPLPEKWHGLQDPEERFRKRYLDILMNDEVRERFETRARIIGAIRAFHEARGFLEVDTPVLHPIPGGTLAKPFVTHHNALNVDFYLRIAKELYLKRLLVAGFEKIYEIGKDFRNEGIDATHNPEFTMLECYAAYWNENDMMAFVEALFMDLVKRFGKKNAVSHEGKEIVFQKPFARLPFADALSRFAQVIDYAHETRDALATRARQLGIDLDPAASKGKIADEIYKKICRPYLLQPTFLVHHPLEISPLAKRRSENPAQVRRFQLIAGGMELTNAFAELNDPLDQRARFAKQEQERATGEEEAMRHDEDFLEALEYGMPPAAGLGIGIDRVIMLFTDVKNIREVLFFPTLRPK